MNVSYLFGQEIFESVLLRIVSLHSFSTFGEAALTLGLLDRSTEEDDWCNAEEKGAEEWEEVGAGR